MGEVRLKKHCTLDQLVRRLETRRHGRGYYHLTLWSSLCKMLAPQVVPGKDERHRVLHLGAAVRMNDESDRRCGKGVYFTCFSFGPAENISMWTNYGIPNQEAVRIRFSKSSMMRWCSEYEAGRIGVYGVNKNGSLAQLDHRPVAKLVDVAYWSKYLGIVNKAKLNDPNKGVLRYFDGTYIVQDPADWRQRLEDGRLKDIAYLFKETGWHYENETRLVLVSDVDMADRYPRLAVDFDGPYSELDKDFRKCVTQGPWYDGGWDATKELAGGHALSEAAPSIYSGTLKMRSVCQGCKQEYSEKCNCPFKGQR